LVRLVDEFHHNDDVTSPLFVALHWLCHPTWPKVCAFCFIITWNSLSTRRRSRSSFRNHCEADMRIVGNGATVQCMGKWHRFPWKHPMSW
jgi:hypothetical protein